MKCQFACSTCQKICILCALFLTPTPIIFPGYRCHLKQKRDHNNNHRENQVANGSDQAINETNEDFGGGPGATRKII